MDFEKKLEIVQRRKGLNGRMPSQEEWELKLPRIDQLFVNTLRKGGWKYDYHVHGKYRKMPKDCWVDITGTSDTEDYRRWVLLLRDMFGYVYSQWNRLVESDLTLDDMIQEHYIAYREHFNDGWGDKTSTTIKSEITTKLRDRTKKANEYNADITTNSNASRIVRENHRRLNEAMAMLIEERGEYRNLEEEIAEVKEHSTNEEFKFLMRDVTYGRGVPYKKMGLTADEYRDKKHNMCRDIRIRIEEERDMKKKNGRKELVMMYPELEFLINEVDFKKFRNASSQSKIDSVIKMKEDASSLPNKLDSIKETFQKFVFASLNVNEEPSYNVDDLKTKLGWQDLFHELFVEDTTKELKCSYKYNKDLVTFYNK